MMLSQRERMVRAINFEPVDRPPIDFGSSPNTTIAHLALRNLLRYLGLEYHEMQNEIWTISRPLQCSNVPEAILERLHVDTRPIFPNLTDEVDWISEDEYLDGWGIRWRAAKTHAGDILYYDMVDHPLKRANSPAEIESYRWPDPVPSGWLDGKREEAQRLRNDTNYALVGHPGDTGVFELAWFLRGMDRFLVDLIQNKDIASAILNHILEIRKEQMKEYLSAVGQYLDVVCIGDDLAMQSAPLMSPRLYQEMIKPYHKRYVELIKSFSPIKLHMHSCGAIAPLIPDLLDIGVDIINPVQVSARGMDPMELMEKFGKRVVFWGGIDTQHVLPQAEPKMVRKEVIDRIDQFDGCNGGYVVSAVHNIQVDVPPENIVAMFDAAFTYQG